MTGAADVRREGWRGRLRCVSACAVVVLTAATLTYGSNAGAAASAGGAGARAAVPGSGGESEFDFLIGEWKVRHRRLKSILRGSSDWYEFDGRLVARKFWQGRGHIDEFTGDGPAGAVDGMSIRIYDPESKQWRDYYTSASRRILDPPLIGRFAGGRAEFYGHELFEGRSIFVRQVWTSIDLRACRWEQAFSEDGGKTWETNWIMDLSR